MIDFHSHILPGIDDGSKSTEESLQMIGMLKKQGADTICATSHYYADQNSPRRFLERRRKAYEALLEADPELENSIVLGAEFLYYPGFSRMTELSGLCYSGTNLLLLEMPFQPWSRSSVQEILDILQNGEYNILLAHIDRYLKFADPASLELLRENGVYIQMNASALNGLWAGSKALRLLREGMVDAIGSDSHNMTNRAPNLDTAYAKIKAKLGPQFTEHFIQNEEQILRECSI